MDESQGLQLLYNKLQDASHGESAVDLLRALDYIPLAITQAAAYINRRARMTISGYLDEFRKNDKKKENLLNWDAGDFRRDTSASNSVVTTWQISFERIREERPSAADLLSLMSFFNPQGIPESILRKYSRNAAELDEDAADAAFDEDFETLQVYSLIAATAETDMCEMQALVQFCTQVWLSSFSNVERWRQKFVGLMAEEFPYVDFRNWAKCQQLLPHVESLYESEPPGQEVVREWIYVLSEVGWYMQSALGKYAEAEKLYWRALEVSEKQLSVQHPDTLKSVSMLASVLGNRGKCEEAEKLHRRALEGYEKELGVQHPSTLTSVNSLAVVLGYQGKYEEAEKLHRRALEGFEKALGAQHPDTLMSVSNLASVLADQGKYEEANKFHRRALEGYEKELGIQHPATLTSVSSLAVVLGYQGKYEEAEKLHRRALEGFEKALGAQHPDTLMSVSNLASVLADQGKYEEANKFHRRALEGREKVLGVQHPDTLTSVSNLALVLRYQGKYVEAEKLNRRALEEKEKEL
ncbi:TPR-like protein [Zopfia rhizophila CBS 207.26]|uniref:TPR-like protein n=1 Tax=Zopfia rhizophila CBS 207.26 TaxID=1314779 RepID=A0A6A6D8Q6_9PEZI|nr:TPR-like protein [Zopfia rhizophila CBS 207.26]